MKVLLLPLLLCLLCAAAASDLLEAAKEIDAWIIDTRRKLHEIPELGFDLPKTSRAVQDALDKIGIFYPYPITQSGIVAEIGSGAPVVGLRADMDGLPIQEQTGLSFASKHEGKMHACGHDAHTAMLLGAARLLKEREKSLKGTVRLFFQPAEEIGRGAEKMIDEGYTKNVSAMLAFHVTPSINTGIVASKPGLMMAGVATFNVTITGKGGHASAPDLSIDPMIPVANTILAYQTIISRTMSPIDSFVISVTWIQGGDAFNVIADSISFGGTMRSLAKDGIQTLISHLTEITNDIAETYGCQSEVNIIRTGPELINNDTITAFARDVAKELFGDDKVMEGKALMSAEDFARFAQIVPAAYIGLGMRNEDPEVNSTAAFHNPHFRVDEAVLHRGAALHAALALEYLNGKSTSPEKKSEL